MGRRKETTGRAQALKRIAEPDDIGGAFLASEDTRWITGDTIHKRRTDMLMLDRRTLLRAGSAAVAVRAALAPIDNRRQRRQSMTSWPYLGEKPMA